MSLQVHVVSKFQFHISNPNQVFNQVKISFTPHGTRSLWVAKSIVWVAQPGAGIPSSSSIILASSRTHTHQKSKSWHKQKQCFESVLIRSVWRRYSLNLNQGLSLVCNWSPTKSVALAYSEQTGTGLWHLVWDSGSSSGDGSGSGRVVSCHPRHSALSWLQTSLGHWAQHQWPLQPPERVTPHITLILWSERELRKIQFQLSIGCHSNGRLKCMKWSV